MNAEVPLLIQSLRGQPIPRPPVWLMRQAGRYLSEYRAVKEKHGFLGMCQSPELVSEITMQPIRILDVDAAILFSDILLPASCLGIRVDFRPGPVVENPVKDRADIERLSAKDPTQVLPYVYEGIRNVRTELGKLPGPPKATIGFAGAPWTMACYLLDQGPYKHFHGTQVFAHKDPQAISLLLSKLATLVADHLQAQIEAGAQAVQLFDTWGGNLSLEDYKRFALGPIQEIFSRLRPLGCPMILYVNGSSHLLSAMSEAGADCLSIDWRTSIPSAEAAIGEKISLQGNFDPTLLFESPDNVASATHAMLSQLKRKTRYICNLGHGVLQATPRESVISFVNSVKSFSWK